MKLVTDIWDNISPRAKYAIRMDSYIKHFVPAMLTLYSRSSGPFRSLCRDLGLPYKDWGDIPVPLPDELRALLEKLSGPHAKTILKAYRIQRGLK